MSEQSLTLYSFPIEILRLVEYREELIAGEYEIFDREERAFAIEECEQRIATLTELQPAKVDSFCGFLRECERREQVDTAEAERILRRAQQWKERRRYLVGRAIAAMQATNQAKLEGQNSTLALRDNPPKVEIQQEALLPAEFRRTTVTLDQQIWNLIEQALEKAGAPILFSHLRVALNAGKTEPKKLEIARVLKSTEPCLRCCGSGGFERKQFEGQRQIGTEWLDCEDCKGIGSIPRGVPGARLVSGIRLEVK
jgi:hypothetical protein